MERIKVWAVTGVVCVLATGLVVGSEELYDVRDYGARPDGKNLCTKFIQQAIDECSKAGGGSVYLSPGTFLSGTIYFKTGVTLKLAAGCTLLCSANLKDYPGYSMFGGLSAYGLYCRHVKGLKMLNVQIQSEKPDKRHALVLEDVEDALIDALDAPCSPDAGAIIRMTDVKGIFIRGCRAKVGTNVFLELRGALSERVVLNGNDLGGAAEAVQRAPDVPKAALSGLGNYLD